MDKAWAGVDVGKEFHSTGLTCWTLRGGNYSPGSSKTMRQRHREAHRRSSLVR
jgi:hypothetical protein